MFSFKKLAGETAQPLPRKSSMNPIDLFIIYLACGAPFGVYYFFQNRTPVVSPLLWFKTFFIFFFWMPFAFLLLRQNKNFRTPFSFVTDKLLMKNLKQEENFHSTVKQIEKVLLESNLKISVYEFREVIERYIGLTIAAQTDAREISAAETEFSRLSRANNKNIELGAKCLNRRNRKRLFLHQTEARKDFLHLLDQLLKFNSDEMKLEHSAIELVTILKDLEARKKLEEMFACALQTGSRFNVTETEKDLWKPEIPVLSPAEQIPYHLPSMKATLNSRRKD